MSKIKLYIILGILGGIMLVGGVSYAVLTLVIEGTSVNELVLGNLSLNLEESNSITLTNVIPTSDNGGKSSAPMRFSVTNNGTITAGYKIYLEDAPLSSGQTRIDNTLIRYQLLADGVQHSLSNLELNETEIYLGNIEPNTTVDFELRVWVDIKTTSLAGGTTFLGKLRIEASQNVNDAPIIPADSCFTFASNTITDYDSTCGSNIIIPTTIGGENVNFVGNYAFNNKGITNVILPNTLQQLGTWAFAQNSLESVILPDSVTTVKELAFFNNNISELYIPTSVISIERSAFNDNSLSDDEAIIYKRNSDGTIDNTYIVSYGGANRESVTIPLQVKSIGRFAFRSCDIKDVIFHDNITYMGEGAFVRNAFTGEDVFVYSRLSDGSINYAILNSYGGANVHDIVIPESVEMVSHYAFFNCLVASITLPSALEVIGESAFSYTNLLTDITIPASVVAVSENAFANSQSLENITILGKSSQSAFSHVGANAFGTANVIYQP